MAEIHAVTGALGYSGRYIAERLMDRGHQVVSLTNKSAAVPPKMLRIDLRPFDFEDPDKLAESLRGVSVLYNTYWVRFNHRRFTHADAIRNTKALFEAARRAGVRRVVHVSITNPSKDSELEYFRGKAELEAALMGSGLSYAILRPAVIFGGADILINNIAWFIRRFPVIGVFGEGGYRLRPIYVEDLAEAAVEAGQGQGNVVINAVGPEGFSYRALVEELARILGKRRLIVPVPPLAGYTVAAMVGMVLGDVVITRQEIEGLMAGLLDTEGPGVGTTRLTDWARAHAGELGLRYHSELARR